MLKKLFANLRPGNDTSAEALFGWHTIIDVMGGTGEPYMTRIWFGRLRLHIFHTADPGRDPHDHPWGFWTFPLVPYVEEMWCPVRDTIVPGEPDPPLRFYKQLAVIHSWRWRRQEATHTHRVLGAWRGEWRWDSPYTGTHWTKNVPGFYATNCEPVIAKGRKVVTIVWRDAPQRKWGFLRRDTTGKFCWVPWRMYVYEGGNHAPCSVIEQEKGRRHERT